MVVRKSKRKGNELGFRPYHTLASMVRKDCSVASNSYSGGGPTD